MCEINGLVVVGVVFIIFLILCVFVLIGFVYYMWKLCNGLRVVYYVEKQ